MNPSRSRREPKTEAAVGLDGEGINITKIHDVPVDLLNTPGDKDTVSLCDFIRVRTSIKWPPGFYYSFYRHEKKGNTCTCRAKI